MAESPRAADLAGATLLSDSELVGLARQGDRRAFGTLYLRHHDAAWRVACAASASPADAEDAVAEGFTKVFAALPRIVDRELAFRPYLLACVRNSALDLHRRDRKIDLRDEIPEERERPRDESDGPVLADLERNLVGEALKSLPERWRTVLWLTEVEGMTPTEVSAVIGIKPNAVAALSYRAREGLREAYLQAHLQAEAPAGCRHTVDRLGPYVRGELAERERTRVQAHLDVCAGCRRRRDELADVNSSLLGSLAPAPLVLGSRTQQEWLAGAAHRRRGARRTRTPARAAQLAERDTAVVAQRALALVVALLLAVAGAVSFERFGDGDRDRDGLDSVALPRQPFTAEPEPATAPAAVPDAPRAPEPAAASPSARRLLAGPPSTAPAAAATPTVPVAAGDVPPATPPPAAPAEPEPPPPPPAPPPSESTAPPPPPPAAAAKASVGEGRTGAVVGAGVPDDGSPPEEPDATVGGEQVSGDAPPPDGEEPPAEAGGSAVPPEVSDAVATVGEIVPVHHPAPDAPDAVRPAPDAKGSPPEELPPAPDRVPPSARPDPTHGGVADAAGQAWGWDSPRSPQPSVESLEAQGHPDEPGNPRSQVERLPAPEQNGTAQATWARVGPTSGSAGAPG